MRCIKRFSYNHTVYTECFGSFYPVTNSTDNYAAGGYETILQYGDLCKQTPIFSMKLSFILLFYILIVTIQYYLAYIQTFQAKLLIIRKPSNCKYKAHSIHTCEFPSYKFSQSTAIIRELTPKTYFFGNKWSHYLCKIS